MTSLATYFLILITFKQIINFNQGMLLQGSTIMKYDLKPSTFWSIVPQTLAFIHMASFYGDLSKPCNCIKDYNVKLLK